MTGRHAGWVTSQGEILADRLRTATRRVHAASTATSRLGRLVGIAAAVVRHRRHADVLLVQTYGGRSFVLEDMASLLGRWLGYRIAFHLHGGALPDFVARYPRWSRRVLARGDAFVAPSPYLARAFRALGHPVHTIPNLVEADAYPFRLRTRVRPRLFWMRSFHEVYNPLLAVRVLARVRARHPDATLVLAGQDKGLEAAVRAEVARRGLADAVRFVGFLDAAGKAREGAASDVFLNTTRVDNTPVAVLEAAAMGLPVVATRVGGIDALLRDGDTALLVPDDDDAAMAAAVLRLHDEPALAARLSRAGQRTAARCGWASVGPRWASFLDGVAAAPRRGR